MILTRDELRDLTERERPTYQARVLEHLGIPFKRRPDGTLVVLRVHVESAGSTLARPEPTLHLDSL